MAETGQIVTQRTRSALESLTRYERPITDVATARASLLLGFSPTETLRSAFFVVLVGLTVVIDAAFYLGGLSQPLVIADLRLPPSVLPMVAVVLVGAARLSGRPRNQRSMAAFWSMWVLVTIVATVSVADLHQLDSVAALLLNGLNEEIIYRFALPAIITFGLTKAGASFPQARLTGFVIAGVWFIFLPGHVRQWASLADVVPFVAFTVLASLAVHRSGAVLEIGLLHGVMNLVNIGRINGDIDAAGGVMMAALTALLLVSYVPPAPRRRMPEPDTIIDLRGDQPVVSIA